MSYKIKVKVYTYYVVKFKFMLFIQVTIHGKLVLIWVLLHGVLCLMVSTIFV